MNNWFSVALIAPVLWSINTHVDKFVLSKKFKHDGIGAVFLFSALFSIPVFAILFYFNSVSVLNLPLKHIIMMLFVGGLSAAAFYFYLLALDIEEASIVVPFFQLIPVFGYFFGYFFLGEVLSLKQILAAVLVLIGIISLALEFEENYKIKLKIRVLFFATISSLLFALHDTLFKVVALTDNFYLTLFWQYAGLSVAGLFVFFCVARYRKQFFGLFQNNSRLLVGINFLAETCYIIGNAMNNFASLLAPLALVLVVSSYQPVFVFLSGTILSVFFPQLTSERLGKKHLIQKILSILIVCLGSYWLINQ